MSLLTLIWSSLFQLVGTHCWVSYKGMSVWVHTHWSPILHVKIFNRHDVMIKLFQLGFAFDCNCIFPDRCHMRFSSTNTIKRASDQGATLVGLWFVSIPSTGCCLLCFLGLSDQANKPTINRFMDKHYHNNQPLQGHECMDIPTHVVHLLTNGEHTVQSGLQVW
jgi:hypothetical protein